MKVGDKVVLKGNEYNDIANYPISCTPGTTGLVVSLFDELIIVRIDGSKTAIPFYAHEVEVINDNVA